MGRVLGDSLNTRAFGQHFFGRRRNGSVASAIDGFLILPLWGRCPEGAERATRQRLGFCYFRWDLIFLLRFICFFILSQRVRVFWGTPNPTRIKAFRAGASGTLINKGLQGRVPGDALNTRGSGHPYLRRPKYSGLTLPKDKAASRRQYA